MDDLPVKLIERLRPLKLLLMDVDGTLSDGRLDYNENWVESKSFDVRDGFGIYLAHTNGLKTGIVTGRNSPLVSQRAKELSIEIVYQSRRDKALVLDEVMKLTGLTANQIAYVGDDLFDLPLLLRVGFAAAPADAHEEVRRRVHFVTQNSGGRGAVREVIELILKGQGRWEEIVKGFCKP
jgi:3-deoxy-D-manno-octulosonate 8-phosphate phosphatase (KDO 8-P phosphatase)